MEDRYEFVELDVADSRQVVLLQLGGRAAGQ